MAELLGPEDLPDGFLYPRQFVRVVELGLTDLEPWLILQGEQLHGHLLGLRKRYPLSSLVPFARRQDNDDVACWDVTKSNVVIIHDFASPGFEGRQEFENFNSWLRQAIDDLIEFDD